MSKKGSKKLFGDFYSTSVKNGEEVRTKYQWKAGEKEEYMRICDIVWGNGYPHDVNWAKSTNSYREEEAKLKKCHDTDTKREGGGIIQ